MCARTLEPHPLAQYLVGLAAAFHGYYNRVRVVTEDEGASRARLALVAGRRRRAAQRPRPDGRRGPGPDVSDAAAAAPRAPRDVGRCGSGAALGGIVLAAVVIFGLGVMVGTRVAERVPRGRRPAERAAHRDPRRPSRRSPAAAGGADPAGQPDLLRPAQRRRAAGAVPLPDGQAPAQRLAPRAAAAPAAPPARKPRAAPTPRRRRRSRRARAAAPPARAAPRPPTRRRRSGSSPARGGSPCRWPPSASAPPPRRRRRADQAHRVSTPSPSWRRSRGRPGIASGSGASRASRPPPRRPGSSARPSGSTRSPVRELRMAGGADR